MTTSSDSSVTKCETCGRTFDLGAHFSDHGPQPKYGDPTRASHPFVPAPAPSSDPVSLGCQDSGHQRLLDAARGMGAERDAFERGRHEGYHAGIAEQLAAPVLSPTEAGPPLTVVAREVYERCLSGGFYSDHDGDLALLGRLREAIEVAEARRGR